MVPTVATSHLCFTWLLRCRRLYRQVPASASDPDGQGVEVGDAAGRVHPEAGGAQQQTRLLRSPQNVGEIRVGIGVECCRNTLQVCFLGHVLDLRNLLKSRAFGFLE